MQLRLHFTIYVGHNTSLHCPGVIKLHMGDNVIHYYKRFEIQSSWTDQPWQCYTHMQTHTCTLTWIFKSWSIGEPRLMNMLTSTPCRILRSIHPHTHTHNSDLIIIQPWGRQWAYRNTEGESCDIVTMMYWAPVSIHLTLHTHMSESKQRQCVKNDYN